MTEQRVQRRLAAILAIDVVGYSALMQNAEEATYAEFERLKRELIEPGLSRHGGRLIKTTGDGALAEFASPLSAVRCAVEIQDQIASGSSPLRLRVGLNLGDVIVGQDGDLYGDGINIAVRLEGAADPGGILISEKVYSEIEGKLGVSVEDRGEQQLKNITKPVRAYALRAGPLKPSIQKLSAPPPLPDRPSIAVLPFENMSGDPEQEYFADGMVEDIITALSRFKSLFVIARNSSFTYKGKTIDIKRVGRELGVRYVLEGSVRKAGGRVRITGQLIEAASGAHLWADRFDGPLEDVFDLQDKVMERVVGAIAPRVQQAEIERARRKPIENLDAYDCLLRGMPGVASFDRAANEDALRLFYRAIDLDPSFATPYGMAARCYMQRKVQGWRSDAAQDEAETRRLALRVAEIGQDDALALSWAGFALAHVCREYEMGATFADQALSLNQNLAAIIVNRGNINSFMGEQEKAIEHFAHGLRLSPLDPEIYRVEIALAIALMLLGRFRESVEWATKSLARQPNWARSVRTLAAAQALAGNLDEARKAMTRMRELDPVLCISQLPQMLPYPLPKDLAMWTEGLRLAGLPE